MGSLSDHGLACEYARALYLTVPYSTVINVPTRLESAISELIFVLVYFKI